jgi:hypothetical protein
VFKSTGAESVGRGRRTLHGNLTLRGQTPAGYGESYAEKRPLRGRGHRKADQLSGSSLPEKQASEPRAKFELNSTCGWHRKTQGGQIKSIKGRPAGGLPAWEIRDEGSGTA